jgi:hypothetical protein
MNIMFKIKFLFICTVAFFILCSTSTAAMVIEWGPEDVYIADLSTFVEHTFDFSPYFSMINSASLRVTLYDDEQNENANEHFRIRAGSPLANVYNSINFKMFNEPFQYGSYNVTSYIGSGPSLYVILDKEKNPGDFMFDKFTITVEGVPIPIPGAVWLIGSGLISIVGIRKKFKR